jgi:hypothetical protein
MNNTKQMQSTASTAKAHRKTNSPSELNLKKQKRKRKNTCLALTIEEIIRKIN